MEVRYGGSSGAVFELVDRDDLVVVRTRSRTTRGTAPMSARSRSMLSALERVVAFDDAGVEVFRTPEESAAELRSELGRDAAFEFAGRCLSDPVSDEPIVYTENVFIQFEERGRSASAVGDFVATYGLEVRRPIGYAPGAWVLHGRSGIGRDVFDAARGLLDSGETRYCHPELVRERSFRSDPLEWHLRATVVDGSPVDAHASVERAWQRSRGERTTIAVIDDGFDVAHAEFSTPGKIVAPRDVTARTADVRPGTGNDHGTPCAAVACAAGTGRATGVAPLANLMPIRLVSGLGSQSEADAFAWAADNGADVISCSWGPTDGDWLDPNDPLHQRSVPLPDSTRVAMEYALSTGRAGRGCVITWAAGNGGESADLDGYASHPEVITVAACNDRSTRSAYSDTGRALWCAFPSSDFDTPDRPAPLTSGIFTADRSGAAGYNSGANPIDTTGDYTDDFGGTSSACPGVAGVAALAISVNPDLTQGEVKELLREACDRIDEVDGNYDPEGHSLLYGYGRVNASRAVELAAEAAERPAPSTFSIEPALPLPDRATARATLHVADGRAITGIRMEVDIDHTWIGDLTVDALAPDGRLLRLWTGDPNDGTRNLRLSASDENSPALNALVGGPVDGVWELLIEDRAARDTGTLQRFAISLDVVAGDVVVEPDDGGGGPAPTGPTLRRDVGGLGSDAERWDPVMSAYADAVGEMQTRPPDDPTSWIYQGAIHGKLPPILPLTNQCQHSSWFFLPWHRMYLHRFEEIVRSIVVANGGPADWALPFWDYSKGGDAGALPWVFRQQQKDGQPNPLFVANRLQARNDGVPMTFDTVRTDMALARPNYIGAFNDPNDPGFGGPVTGFNHGAGLPGMLEVVPHGSVHMRVGGLMTDFNTAALDPIFWLHHANIDRLWEEWLADGNHANPADSTWMDFAFELFDANGQRRSMRVRDVLDTEAQLGYRYEGVAPGPREQRRPEPVRRRSAMPREIPAEMIGATDEAVVLSGGQARIAVRLAPPERRRATRGVGGTQPPQRVLLTVDDITADGVPNMPYAVVVDMGQEGDEDDYVVGVVSFFGFAESTRTDAPQAPHGLRYSFDITEVHARLQEQGVWDESEVRVLFRPVEEHTAGENEVDVSIGRVAIYFG